VPQLGWLIRFLRATGMRAGEALRAEWGHLNGSHLTITETKSGRIRTIEAPPAALPPRREAGRIFRGLPDDTGAPASRWPWVKRNMPPEQHFRLHDLATPMRSTRYEPGAIFTTCRITSGTARSKSQRFTSVGSRAVARTQGGDTADDTRGEAL